MLKNLMLILLVLIYLVALFYSLFMQIDGLGILAIAMSIMLFVYIMYAMNKQPKASSMLTSSEEINNIPQLLKFASSPTVIRLLPHVLSMIVALLEKHHDKLESKQRKKLQEDMKQLVDSVNSWRSTSKTKGT